MRIVVLLAASALVAGCSSTTGGDAVPSSPATSPSSGAARTTPGTSARPPAGAPAPGAPIADVIAWIGAGTPADGATFHSATRDGATSDLGADVAFTGPAGTPNCMTDAGAGGALACLVDLADPPPQPADVYGQWKGNWVDFDGTSVEVGSAHGDPGRFGAGTGAELPAGRVLSFGDYRCRTDAATIYCVNFAHQSGVAFAATGIQTYGCLKPATAPPGIGRQFSC
jgi:hypothetical protein